MAKGYSLGGLIKALGSAAFLDVGKGTGQVAAGDDSRIVNALDKTKNLSDVPNKLEACKNIQAFPLRGSLGNIGIDKLGAPISEGLWYQERDGHGAVGYPLDNITGSLMVQRTGDRSAAQTFVEASSGRTWTRAWTGKFWTGWGETLLNTRKINGKPLSADITLTAGDVGAYSKTESDSLYQPKGSYQPKGNYATAGSSYTKMESDSRYSKPITGWKTLYEGGGLSDSGVDINEDIRGKIVWVKAGDDWSSFYVPPVDNIPMWCGYSDNNWCAFKTSNNGRKIHRAYGKSNTSIKKVCVAIN